MKRLWLDINLSGVVGGYTNRYCLAGWQGFEQFMIDRAVFQQTYNPMNNPNWRPPPKPRIRIVAIDE